MIDEAHTRQRPERDGELRHRGRHGDGRRQRLRDGIGNVDLCPGEISQTVAVTIIGDLVKERNETFFVNLTGATNAAIGRSRGRCISNDDET